MNQTVHPLEPCKVDASFFDRHGDNGMSRGTRRRPGQRTIASKARDPNGYDLDRDSAIRARARFEGLSLGEACRKYGDSLTYPENTGESFIASERFSYLPNEELSESEAAIHESMAEVRQEGLPNLPVSLQSGAYKAVLAKLKAGATRARRARATVNVIAHVAELGRQPRYIRLNLGVMSEGGVPY